MVGWRHQIGLDNFFKGRLDAFRWLAQVPENQRSLTSLKPLVNIESASNLAQEIVDTIREPLVVLDEKICVVTASRSFYRTFLLDSNEIRGQSLYKLSGGAWNIGRIRLLLRQVAQEYGAIEDVEIEQNVKVIGKRTLLLNARKIFCEKSTRVNILLSISDITEERLLRREKDEMLREKETLLAEIKHRIANNLQIVASIISLKSRKVKSEESRRQLEDIHSRVISIAAVQQYLNLSIARNGIDLLPYLSKLCEALSCSMVGDSQRISIIVRSVGSSVTAHKAESLGLIVTELVINSLKHAFTTATKNGQIIVSYDVSGDDWTLSVSDNGLGKRNLFAKASSGLGAGILNSLGRQLGAEIKTISGPQGTTVTVSHAANGKRLECEEDVYLPRHNRLQVAD